MSSSPRSRILPILSLPGSTIDSPRSSFSTPVSKESFTPAQPSPRLDKIMIHEPGVGLQLDPIWTKLSWNRISNIFRHTSLLTSPVPEFDSIDVFNVDPIYAELTAFHSTHYSFTLNVVDVAANNGYALIRKWSNADTRLWLVITEECFAVAFEGPTTYLVLANHYCSLMVSTPTFTFEIDRPFEITDVTSFPSLSLKEVKTMVSTHLHRYLSLF